MNFQDMTKEELVDELRRMEIRIITLKASEERHRSTEKEPRESEERYRSLVKQSADCVYIFDPKSAKILEAKMIALNKRKGIEDMLQKGSERYRKTSSSIHRWAFTV